MNDEAQGVEHAEPVADATLVSENADTNEAEALEVVETVADVEEVEVDHKVLSEQLKRETEGKQGKIDKQRAALSQANAKIQEMQQQLAQTLKVEAPLEPQWADYDTMEDFDEAKSEFKGEIKYQAKMKEQREREIQEKRDSLNAEQSKKFEAEEQEYRATNPDYDRSKVELQDYLQTSALIHGPVGDAIYEAASNIGMAKFVDYYGSNSGENIAELEKLTSLSPVGAAYEIFKLGQKLSGVKPEKSKPLPKPVKTVSGSGSSKKDLSDGDVLKNLGLK